MIKKYLFAGAMTLAAVLGMAADKLTVVFSGYPIHNEDLTNVKEISYVEGKTPGQYTHMKVEHLDGTSKEIYLYDSDEIVYQADRGENPVKIKGVIPHYHCCEIDIEAPEGVFYRVSGMPKSMLDMNGIDPSAWADCLVTDDINYINYVAESTGFPLANKKEKDVFEYGSQLRPWFPQEVASEPTDYVIALYTAKIEDGQVVVTSEPELVEFKTKELYDLGVKWNLSVEFNSLAMTVKADVIEQEGVDTDIPFAINVYTAEQIATYPLPQLVAQSIQSYENQVYKGGMSWDDVTFHTSGSRTYTNIRPGDMFVAVAYGLEWGVANTDASWFIIEAPQPKITDDCTFTLAANQTSTTGVNVDIEPSNADTRYVAFLTTSERIKNNLPAETEQEEGEEAEEGEQIDPWTMAARIYVDNHIHYLNQTNPKYWYNREKEHTGKVSLDSYTDLIDGQYMAIGEKYTIVVCGIAEDGGRCTEVSTIEVSTEAEPEVKELGFEVEFFDYKPSQYYPSIGYKITPTDPEQTYVAEFMRVGNTNADLSKSDEEFIKNYVSVQGQYLRLRNGVLESRHNMANDYNYELGEYRAADYYLFIFGYNGAATTPLYAIKLTGESGDVEQVRGEPTILKQEVVEPTEPLSLEMNFSNWNGSDNSFHFITCNVTPSDNVSKYIFKVLNEDAINPEGQDAETFLTGYIETNKDKLIASPGEKQERVQFEKSSTSADAKFNNKYFLAFGYDGTKATTKPILYYVNGTTGKVTAIYE